MKLEQIGKITDVKVPDVIFADANSGAFFDFKNYRSLTFLVVSGEGTAGNTTITVEAKTGEDGTPVAIPFYYLEKGDEDYSEKPVGGQVFAIGGGNGESKHCLVCVTSDMLASGDYDRVAINTTAVTDSTVVGAIFAIQTQPRYNG